MQVTFWVHPKSPPLKTKVTRVRRLTWNFDKGFKLGEEMKWQQIQIQNNGIGKLPIGHFSLGHPHSPKIRPNFPPIHWNNCCQNQTQVVSFLWDIRKFCSYLVKGFAGLSYETGDTERWQVLRPKQCTWAGRLGLVLACLELFIFKKKIIKNTAYLLSCKEILLLPTNHNLTYIYKNNS